MRLPKRTTAWTLAVSVVVHLAAVVLLALAPDLPTPMPALSTADVHIEVVEVPDALVDEVETTDDAEPATGARPRPEPAVRRARGAVTAVPDLSVDVRPSPEEPVTRDWVRRVETERRESAGFGRRGSILDSRRPSRPSVMTQARFGRAGLPVSGRPASRSAR